MKIPFIIGIIALAVVLGVGMVTTEFTTYLGDDPTTCNNCHVMDAVYEGWYHAGHQAWANCTDCHVPHSFIPKYFMKAKSGFNHVRHFTFGTIPDPIRAKAGDRQNHPGQLYPLPCGDGFRHRGRANGRRTLLFDCHRSVAHGERGISILPHQDKGIYDPKSIQLYEETPSP